MSNKARPSKKIAAEQASKYQQEIAELLNPEIEYNRNEAIAKSPQVIACELICFDHLPDKIKCAINEAGLAKELLQVPSKTQWQAPKTGDKIQHLLRWISRYNKIVPYQKKPELVFE